MAKKPAIAEPETVAVVEAPVEAPSNVFTNTTEATTIHLGDGRKLAPGESAEVDPALLAVLRGDA